MLLSSLPRCRVLTIIAGLLLTCSTLHAQRVLYIGDSVTDGGWGRSGGSMAPSDQRNQKDLNHIYGHSYMMLCAAHYESTQPYAGLKFFNRGISGNTLDDLKERWQQDVLDLKPDILSVLIGTNDVWNYIKEHDFEVLIVLGAGDLDNQVPQITKLLNSKF